MSRRAARVDENQGAIVDALRSLGCSVQSLASLGKGVPDLLVGIRGVNLLVEVKNPASSGDKLTPDQLTWHLGWLGQVAVIRTVEQASALVRAVEKAVAFVRKASADKNGAEEASHRRVVMGDD